MSTREPSVAKIYAGYLGLRLILFIIAFAIFFLIGLSGLWSVILGLVASGIASYPIARRQRDDIVNALARRKTGK